LKRGPKPGTDTIELKGVFPTFEVCVGSVSVSCSHDVPMYWDQTKVKSEAEGTLILEPR
jgi:hypothetical protein